MTAVAGVLPHERERSTHMRPVLLDLYGTLVTVDRDVPRTWQLLSECGYPSSAEVEAVWSPDAFNGCRTPKGADYRDWQLWLYREHARACGVPEHRLAAVVARLAENDRAWTVRALPGAAALLRALRDEARPVAIVTNWDYPVSTYLRQAGLPLDLPAVASWEVGARKPDGAIFLTALERLDARPSACAPAVLGDGFDCDIVGALRLGFDPVWLSADRSHTLVGLGRVVRATSLEEATRYLCG